MTVDLKAYVEAKFEGLTREQLREAGEMLGVTFGPATHERTMRIKLCEKIGEGIPESTMSPPPDDTPKKPEPVRLMRMQRPRLAPGDIWEGRRYRVQVARAPENAEHKSFVLQWNFVARSFAYDTMIDMPEPYYNLLKVKVGRVVQEKEKDKDGNWIGNINRDVYTPRFSFQDYGMTPGTENLPGSILEYWQIEAKKKDYFRALLRKNTGRNTLIQIRADLMGSVGPGFYKDLTNEDIWQDIIKFLGFEDILYEESEEELA